MLFDTCCKLTAWEGRHTHYDTGTLLRCSTRDTPPALITTSVASKAWVCRLCAWATTRMEE